MAAELLIRWFRTSAQGRRTGGWRPHRERIGSAAHWRNLHVFQHLWKLSVTRLQSLVCIIQKVISSIHRRQSFSLWRLFRDRSLLCFSSVSNQRNNLFVKSFYDSCTFGTWSQHFITISSRNSQLIRFVLLSLVVLFRSITLWLPHSHCQRKTDFCNFSQIFLNTTYTFFCFASQGNYFRCIISFKLSYCSTNAFCKKKGIRFYTSNHDQ